MTTHQRPNVNIESGIPYGTIDARHVPGLFEQIQASGTNVSYLAWKQGLIEELANILHTYHDGKRDLAEQELAAWLGANWDQTIDNEFDSRTRCKSKAKKILADYDGTEQTEDDDAAGIFEDLELAEHYDEDQDTYTYQEGEGKNLCRYQLGYLGGAPLIWVIQSPVTTTCRRCSPCVPNAGNLDSPDPDGGITCYDIPPDWKNQDDEH